MTKGGGVQKSQKIDDVFYERPLTSLMLATQIDIRYSSQDEKQARSILLENLMSLNLNSTTKYIL